MSAVRLSLIVAADKRDTIGNQGQLPWHLPEDLAHFRALTMGHVVVAGRVTQDSIVARLDRPLPGRTTVVVTRQPAPAEPPPDVHYAHSVDEALTRATYLAGGSREVFVIGGAQIYRAALPRITTVYLTRVEATVPGDCAMPAGWLDAFGKPVERDERDGFTFETYER